MTTETEGHPGYGMPLGLGDTLASLLADADVVKAQERANARSLLRKLYRAYVRGELRSQDVEREQRTRQGLALAQQGPGHAALSLFLALALLDERRPESVALALVPAEQEPATRATAAVLKGRASEALGDQASVDVCVEVLVREKARLLLALLLGGLEIMSTEKGIRASVEADSLSLEAAAQRLLYLHRLSEEQGLRHPVDSILQAFRSNLQGEYEEAYQAFWWHEYGQPTTDQKEGWLVKAPIAADQLQKETGGRAQAGLEEFAELVRLLAIEDPFDMWNELARLISADWPEGLSAEEAVSQGRE